MASAIAQPQRIARAGPSKEAKKPSPRCPAPVRGTLELTTYELVVSLQELPPGPVPQRGRLLTERRCPKRGPWRPPGLVRSRPACPPPRPPGSSPALRRAFPDRRVRARSLRPRAPPSGRSGCDRPSSAHCGCPNFRRLPVHDEGRDTDEGKQVAHVDVDVHPDVGRGCTGADAESKDASNATALLLTRAGVHHPDELVREAGLAPAALELVGSSLHLGLGWEATGG